MLFSINTLLQLVQISRANINTHKFTNCSILLNNISIFKLDGSAWALSPATRTDEYHNTDFALGNDPGAVLDQYLDKEELEELILEEGNVFNNDLPQRTSGIDVFDNFQ